MRTSLVVPYAAYLRVYEPLDAFDEAERARWVRHASAAREAAGQLAQHERRQSLANVIPTPPLPVPEREGEQAFLAEVDGTLCVCPCRVRLRSWLALRELPEHFDEPLLGALLPPVVREEAALDFDRWRVSHPDARPSILTSTWHVPVGWFVLFAEEDRQHAEEAARADEARAAEGGGGPTGGGATAVGGEAPPGAGRPDAEQPVRGLRYRTPMVQARRRVARGLRTLRRANVEGGLPDRVEQTGRWLEEFHPRSMVELDYGGLVHVLTAEELAEDRSAADVADGLAALAEGDQAAASAAYQRIAERWQRVRALSFAS